jgi:hopene-associated glycosyltransferase HpnB
MICVIVHVLAALPLFVWLFLLVGRGGFWRVSRLIASAAPMPSAANVVAVIPARDEADVIGDSVQSLLRQNFSGSLHVIVIDDGSTDGTARAASQAAADVNASTRLSVLSGMQLPAGWTGKLWAQSQGVAAAASLNPDYLLLTDADIHHDPGNLAALLAAAQTRGLDLVSFMVLLSVDTFPERCLIPAFVFFFLMLYPPSAIASRGSKTAGAAGGCMLIRPAALERIGGLQSIRSQLIDDCALARAVKSSGGSVLLQLTHGARSTRQYGSFAEIGRMIARSAFYQLHHSWWLLCGTIIGLTVTYLLPVLLLISADPVAASLGGAAWFLMTAAYAPMIRFYRLSPLWSACLPVIAMFYAGATLHSALQYLQRRGGHWKGRVQDVRAPNCQ